MHDSTTLAVGLLLLSANALANDEFSNPTVIEYVDLSTEMTFSTVGATTDTPRTLCPSLDSLVWEDVWLTYVQPRNGATTITVCGDFAGRVVLYQSRWSYDTIVQCADFAGGCHGDQAIVTFDGQLGLRYYIRIGGVEAGQSGAGRVHIAQQGIEYRIVAVRPGDEMTTFPPTMDGGEVTLSGLGGQAIVTVQVRRTGAGDLWDGVWTAGGTLSFLDYLDEGVTAPDVLQPLGRVYEDPSGARFPTVVQGGLWPAWVIRNSGTVRSIGSVYGVDGFFGSQALGPWAFTEDDEWLNLYSVLLTLQNPCARPIRVRFDDSDPAHRPAAVPLIVRPDGWPDPDADYTVGYIHDGRRMTIHVDGPPCEPCVCEWTNDLPAQVTIEDLLGYLSDWFAVEDRAELTGDMPPVIDSLDLAVFLDCWLSASPRVACQ